MAEISGLSLTAFVFAIAGLASIIFSSTLLSPIFFILGIVFSFIARKKSRDKFSTAALIISITGLILSVFLIIYSLYYVSYTDALYSDIPLE